MVVFRVAAGAVGDYEDGVWVLGEVEGGGWGGAEGVELGEDLRWEGGCFWGTECVVFV